MSENNLYKQRIKFEHSKSATRNISRVKKLAISAVASCALVAGFAAPAFAASTNGTPNPNACFGQARSYYAQGGPNSVLHHNEGYYMSARKGSNSTDNINFRQNCL